MAKKQFVAGETNKAEAIREVLKAVGDDVPNDVVKAKIAEAWTDFGWGTNPAAEIFAARKSLGKTGRSRPGRKKKGRKVTKKVAIRRGRPPRAAAAARHPLGVAVELLSLTDDPQGVLAKAQQLVDTLGAKQAAEIAGLL